MIALKGCWQLSICCRITPRWAVVMFKKRYLPILIVLLLVISTTVPIAIEGYRIYAVCRDKLSSSDSRLGSGWKYQYIVFSSDSVSHFPPPITVVFDDGVNTLWCHVHRNGSKWEVDTILATMVAPLP